MAPVSLAIMAKAPSLGAPKTRLQPPLNAAEARHLAAAFLRDTVAMATACNASVFIAGTPAEGSAEIAVLTGLPADRIFPQRGEGLSARCAGAFQTLFAQGAQAALLIGADTPHLPSGNLQQAVDALSQSGNANRLVLGPSDDGGYYLIGLRRESAGRLPALLDGMVWSTPDVFAETAVRAAAAGLDLILLPRCYDIDTPPDLIRLRTELSQPAAACVAQHTRAALQRLCHAHDEINL
jgi:rSAM/selenodomain-associated transferase 1